MNKKQVKGNHQSIIPLLRTLYFFASNLTVSNFAPLYIVSMIETINRSLYPQYYDALRLWLKTKRDDKGLSIRALAEKLGRLHSIVGKIDIVEFVEYCRVLEVDPHEGLDIIISDKVVRTALK